MDVFMDFVAAFRLVMITDSYDRARRPSHMHAKPVEQALSAGICIPALLTQGLLKYYATLETPDTA